MKRITFFFGFFALIFSSNAQHLVKVLDSFGNPMNLQKIKYIDQDYWVDASSCIKLDSAIYSSDTLTVEEYMIFPKIGLTDRKTRNEIEKIAKNLKCQSLDNFAPFEYNAYNKFFIYSDKKEEREKLLEKYSHVLKIKLYDTLADHHLLLSESKSVRKYFSRVNEQEIVTWSKLSGVDESLFLSLNSQLQTLDISEKHLKIITTKYVNPLHTEAWRGYHFSKRDSLMVDGKKLIQYYFFPKAWTRFEAIKGFFWIESASNQIVGITCVPVYGRKAKSYFSLQLHANSQGQYVPYIRSTGLVLNGLSSSRLNVFAIQETYISNFHEEKNLTKNLFSDLALTYRTVQEKEIIRPVPLNTLEVNTYSFYGDKEQLKIYQPLKFGEQLFFGKIRLKYFDIKLNELIKYNDFEKLRTGLSIISNENSTGKHLIATSFGYGWGDRKWKGRLTYQYPIIADSKLNLGFSLSKDLEETGITNRDLVNYFYGTEWIRNLNIKRFDSQKKIEFLLDSKPIKYLNLLGKIQIYNDIPQYNYQYVREADTLTSFNIRTFSLSLRYAYGEKFFRLYNEQINFKSPYPIFWLHVEKSLRQSQLDFARLQIRGRYTHQFIMNGTSKVEALVGSYWGELPFFKLFNGLGSSELKTTINNSFETMGYNEFMASQYFVVFYSHNFGFFNVTWNKTIRPKIILNFNYGLGYLENKQNHLSITNEDFRKGYAEIGTSIDDLILVYPFGIKLSLGASFYHRLGAYRYKTFKQNSILKLTTGFVI